MPDAHVLSHDYQASKKASRLEKTFSGWEREIQGYSSGRERALLSFNFNLPCTRVQRVLISIEQLILQCQQKFCPDLMNNPVDRCGIFAISAERPVCVYVLIYISLLLLLVLLLRRLRATALI